MRGRTGPTGVDGSGAVVLGLCAFTHDSAAALLLDGELIGFVEEERLNGTKHTKAFPERSVSWLLDHHGLAPRDVTVVAYNFVPKGYVAAALRPVGLPRAAPRARSFITVAGNTRRRLMNLQERFPRARVTAIRHHLAHGVYAHLASGFRRSAVLVVDSLGERETTTIAVARGVYLRQVFAVHDPHSLGYVYGAITEHLGFRRGDEEGTVMALAALGDPARFRNLLHKAVELAPTGVRVDPRSFPVRVLDRRFPRVSTRFAQQTCTPRNSASSLEQVHADLAAALQERTEAALLHLGQLAIRWTGEERICVGGGVAMNCVGIGRLTTSGMFDEVFVPPAPGDSGTAIGAAAAALIKLGAAPGRVAARCYLGPSYDEHQVRSAVLASGLRCERIDNPAPFLAERLEHGNIVGLFQGAVEAGPRALGNRSILASPLVPGTAERLNAEVKFREPFRPFAPVVLADQATEWFQLPQTSPYMSIAVPVSDRGRQRLSEITHLNGLARVQTVTARQNRLLTRTLEAFAERTGVPVLINTSLNLKGQPICGTPEMALRCLRASGLDGLLLEGWWVTR